MRVRFYVSVGLDGVTFKDRVLVVANALRDGAAVHGDTVDLVHNGRYAGPADDVDVACCWGIMGNSKEIASGYRAAGKRVLMFDKALIRRLGNERVGHYRVGIDGPSPVKYLMREARSWQRWESLRIEIQSRRVHAPDRKTIVVFAGSSQKYCDFYDLGDANDYAESILGGVRERLRKVELVYRPKPSWPDARQIEGARFSGGGESLLSLLRTARILITHGSAAAVEAIVSGVPAITLGPNAAQFVSGLSLDDLRNPHFVSDEARWAWACNLAWCQWTADELRSGEAWKFLKGEMEATA